MVHMGMGGHLVKFILRMTSRSSERLMALLLLLPAASLAPPLCTWASSSSHRRRSVPLTVALRVTAQPAETDCLPCPGFPAGWLLAASWGGAPLAGHPVLSAGLQHEALPAVLFWGHPGGCHSVAAPGLAMRCPVRDMLCCQAVAGGAHVVMDMVT